MILPILQIVVGVALIVVILLQQQSSGLGGAFGGASSEFFHTRRGSEKILFNATIILSVLFFVLAIVAIAGIF